VRVQLPEGAPYVTYAIIGVTALVYLLQYASAQQYQGPRFADQVEAIGAMAPDLIRQQGEIWRFLTPILLHASVPHIVLNMWALFVFGRSLEVNYGRWRFLLLYLLAGFAGNVLSFLHFGIVDPQGIGYSVGASTAIFGLLSAEGVFLYQNRSIFGRHTRGALTNLIIVVVLNLLLGFIPGIDYWGHIGGLLGGLLFAWFASPVWELQGTMPNFYVVDKREPRSVITGAALVILIFGALAVWGIVA
jgi:rhomboid protease GluP